MLSSQQGLESSKATQDFVQMLYRLMSTLEQLFDADANVTSALNSFKESSSLLLINDFVVGMCSEALCIHLAWCWHCLPTPARLPKCRGGLDGSECDEQSSC